MTAPWIFVAVGALAMLGAIVIRAVVIRSRRDRLAAAVPTEPAVQDVLANRRQFERDVRERRVAGDGETATLMVVVDDLDLMNDRFGPDAAEDFLSLTQAAVQSAIRADDVPYRFASDEFCVLVHDADDSDLARVAARIRAAILDASTSLDAVVNVVVDAIATQSSRVTVTLEPLTSAALTRAAGSEPANS